MPHLLRSRTIVIYGWVVFALVGQGLVVAATHAQTIRGTVTDSVTSRPLAGVRVALIRLPNTTLTVTVTDSAGAYILESRGQDTVWLHVLAAGYAPIRTAPIALTSGGSVRVDVTLSPAPIALDPLAATTTVQGWNLQEFSERQSKGWGRYLGPEQIAALPPKTAVQAVLRIGGSRYLADDRGTGILMQAGERGYCVPRVFIDGVVQLPPDQGARLPGQRRPRGFDTDALISASSIRGVEVYHRPADAPVEYHNPRDNACGIVLFWTDRGLGIR